jgi:hypothetical protein
VLLPFTDFERLMELARRTEAVGLEIQEEDIPTVGLMRLADRGGAFAFCPEEGEDIYTTRKEEPI